MVDSPESPGEPTTNLAEAAVDVTLGLIAVGAGSLRLLPALAIKLPIRAASVALEAAERAQRDYPIVRARGAQVRERLTDLVAARLLGPPIVDDEPAEVDPFDLILVEGATTAGATRTPFVVVTDAEVVEVDVIEVELLDDPVESSDTDADEPAGGVSPEELDEMSLGTLRSRARTLAIPELEALLDHERTLGRREGHLALLETRIAQLHQEQSTG